MQYAPLPETLDLNEIEAAARRLRGVVMAELIRMGVAWVWARLGRRSGAQTA